jgi:ketosteroid isomerase-like protein
LSRIDVVRKYLELQDSNQIEDLLGLLADDAVMSYPMRGPARGKQEIEEALRTRPGVFKPEYADAVEKGETVEVVGKLPAGSPIPAVTFSFGFQGELISRIDIRM